MMRGKPPFWAKRQYPVMCAGPTRFATDFRNLRSLWDPSDMCKRIGHEDCVVRRTALPKTPPVRTVRLLWPFPGPDAGVFASALALGHLGPRQRTDVHLGLLFDEGEDPLPRQWGNVAGRQKCPFRLVSLPNPTLRVIRYCRRWYELWLAKVTISPLGGALRSRISRPEYPIGALSWPISSRGSPLEGSSFTSCSTSSVRAR